MREAVPRNEASPAWGDHSVCRPRERVPSVQRAFACRYVSQICSLLRRRVKCSLSTLPPHSHSRTATTTAATADRELQASARRARLGLATSASCLSFATPTFAFARLHTQ